MKISTQTRYALRFLVELALHESKSEPEDRITTQQVSQKQHISEKYLESIASKLKKAGFVDSLKGVKGGYRLAMPLEQITLGHVMRVMETTYFQKHCVENPEKTCPNFKGCAFANCWDTLEENISGIVDCIMLKDIAAQVNNNRNKE